MQMPAPELGAQEAAPECNLLHFTPLFLCLVAHLGSILFRGKNAVVSTCFMALVVVSFLASTLQHTAVLTYMHMCLGMIATEGSMRVIRAPLWAAPTKADLFAVIAVIVPNICVVLSETILWRCEGVDMLACNLRPQGRLDYGSFARNPLYKKQHAILHGAICFMMFSMASSYSKRLRTSPKIQLVRSFIDPTCMVTIGHILVTHSHGDVHHELASHPVIGTMLYVLAATFFLSCMAQIAYAPGSDLTAPLPKGGPGALLMPRLVCAFSALVIANFLYVDTFMEYMNCRVMFIKTTADVAEIIPEGPIDEHTEIARFARLGWSPYSELSTYLAVTFMLAAATFALMILVNPEEVGLPESMYGGGASANSSYEEEMALKETLLTEAGLDHASEEVHKKKSKTPSGTSSDEESNA